MHVDVRLTRINRSKSHLSGFMDQTKTAYPLGLVLKLICEKVCDMSKGSVKDVVGCLVEHQNTGNHSITQRVQEVRRMKPI